jgi:hypothetical protein
MATNPDPSQDIGHYNQAIADLQLVQTDIAKYLQEGYVDGQIATGFTAARFLKAFSDISLSLLAKVTGGAGEAVKDGYSATQNLIQGLTDENKAGAAGADISLLYSEGLGSSVKAASSFVRGDASEGIASGLDALSKTGIRGTGGLSTFGDLIGGAGDIHKGVEQLNEVSEQQTSNFENASRAMNFIQSKMQALEARRDMLIAQQQGRDVTAAGDALGLPHVTIADSVSQSHQDLGNPNYIHNLGGHMADTGFPGHSAAEAAAAAQAAAEHARQHETESQQDAQQAHHQETDAQQAAQQSHQHETEAQQAAQQAHQHEAEAQQAAQQTHQHETEAQQAAQQAHQHEAEAQQAAQQTHQHETEAQQAAQQATQHETEAAQASQQTHQHETEAQQAAQQTQQHESEAVATLQQIHQQHDEASAELQQIHQFREEVDALRHEAHALRDEIAHLREDSAHLHSTIEELKAHAEQSVHQIEESTNHARQAADEAHSHAEAATNSAHDASASAARANMYAGN